MDCGGHLCHLRRRRTAQPDPPPPRPGRSRRQPALLVSLVVADLGDETPASRSTLQPAPTQHEAIRECSMERALSPHLRLEIAPRQSCIDARSPVVTSQPPPQQSQHVTSAPPLSCSERNRRHSKKKTDVAINRAGSVRGTPVFGNPTHRGGNKKEREREFMQGTRLAHGPVKTKIWCAAASGGARLPIAGCHCESRGEKAGATDNCKWVVGSPFGQRVIPWNRHGVAGRRGTRRTQQVEQGVKGPREWSTTHMATLNGRLVSSTRPARTLRLSLGQTDVLQGTLSSGALAAAVAMRYLPRLYSGTHA